MGSGEVRFTNHAPCFLLPFTQLEIYRHGNFISGTYHSSEQAFQKIFFIVKVEFHGVKAVIVCIRKPSFRDPVFIDPWRYMNNPRYIHQLFCFMNIFICLPTHSLVSRETLASVSELLVSITQLQSSGRISVNPH